MPRHLFAVCTFVTLALAVNNVAHAQGTGGSSAFRNSGMGSSGFGSSGFGSGMGSSGFGSSGFGSSGFGSSGFGSSGFGSSGFGSSGFGSGGSGGFGGGQFGSSGNGYGGGQQGGGQSFVGRDATDMQNVFGQTSHAANQFINQMNRNMTQNNGRKRQSKKTVQNPPQPMRVEVRVAFTPPQLAPSQMAEALRARVSKILVDHHMSAPGLSIQGDTAVISGVASSDSERAVIGQLIALQPGVGQVRNEMTVATAPNAAIVPAPGS